MLKFCYIYLIFFCKKNKTKTQNKTKKNKKQNKTKKNKKQKQTLPLSTEPETRIFIILIINQELVGISEVMNLNWI